MTLAGSRKYALGIAISAFCLWLAVRKVNFADFMQALSGATKALIVPAFLITIGVCLLRVVRWRVLFSFARNIPATSLLSVLMVGFLANNLLPARLGDIGMAFLLHQKEGIGKSRAMGVILLDRLFDVIALVCLMSGALLVYDLPRWVTGIVVLGLAGCLVVLMVIFLLVRNQRRSRVLAERVMSYLPHRISDRLMQIFVMALEGMAVVASPQRMVVALIVSLLIWALLGVGVYVLALAYNFDLTYFSAIVVMGIVNLGLIIPSSPGFVGTFQLFCVTALGLFGIEKSGALSFSVIYHLSQWLPTTVIGYYFLSREKLVLSSFKNMNGPHSTETAATSDKNKGHA